MKYIYINIFKVLKMKLKQSRKKAKDIIETINTKKSSGSKITPIFEEPIQQRTSKMYTLPESKQGLKSQIEKGANTKAELPKLSSSLDDKNDPSSELCSK